MGRWIVIAITYSLILSALVWMVNERFDRPEIMEVEKIRYRDRYITKTDTVSTDRPVTRTIYKRETETVNVCKPAPLKFDPYGFIPRHPVKVNRDSFTLTFWQPDSLRWMQDTYRTKRKSWSLVADMGAECGVLGCTADARLTGRYKAASAFVGYQAAEAGYGPLFGARFRVFGL